MTTTDEIVIAEAAPLDATFDYNALDAESRIVVRQKTGEIREHLDQMQRSAIQVGQRLIEIKERLGHGHWGRWLEAEFRWSDQTATNFMNAAQLAGENPKFLEFEDRLARSALTALAAPSTPPEAREEAITRAGAGEKITNAKAQEIIAQHKPTSTSRPAPAAPEPALSVPASPHAPAPAPTSTPAPAVPPPLPGLSPAPASPVPTLPPALPGLSPVQAVREAVDHELRKLLVAKHQLLQHTLDLIADELQATLTDATPTITIHADAARAAARAFLNSPGLGGPAAMLAFSAVVGPPPERVPIRPGSGSLLERIEELEEAGAQADREALQAVRHDLEEQAAILDDATYEGLASRLSAVEQVIKEASV